MHNHFFFSFIEQYIFFSFLISIKKTLMYYTSLYYFMIFLSVCAFRYQNNQNNDNIFPELLVFPNRFIFL